MTMHRWTDGVGQRWECDAYDHGPFCRQCRLVGVTDNDIVNAMDERRGVTITQDDEGVLTLHWFSPDTSTRVHRDVLQGLVDQVNAAKAAAG